MHQEVDYNSDYEFSHPENTDNNHDSDGIGGGNSGGGSGRNSARSGSSSSDSSEVNESFEKGYDKIYDNNETNENIDSDGSNSGGKKKIKKILKMSSYDVNLKNDKGNRIDKIKKYDKPPPPSVFDNWESLQARLNYQKHLQECAGKFTCMIYVHICMYIRTFFLVFWLWIDRYINVCMNI